MTQLEPGSEPKHPINRARRHFLGVAAAVAAKAAALGGLAATIVPSSAHAKDRWKIRIPPIGKHRPPGRGGGRGPACFLRGTSILTSRGEVPIENLQIGDLVQTADGRALPVQWIGHRTYRKSGPCWPEGVMPIRVMRGALADQVPRRDLYLSPDHALFIDGALVRVKELVNGISIAPALPDDRQVIEYFNPVLASHEAVLAEGAAAETFLLQGRNHEVFANFAEYERLYPHHPAAAPTPFAPILGYEGGREHLKALLGLAASPFIRVRDPVQDIYRKLAARAEELVS